MKKPADQLAGFCIKWYSKNELGTLDCWPQTKGDQAQPRRSLSELRIVGLTTRGMRSHI